MCAIQGIEPRISEMPIDIEDFPQIVRDALEAFNRLPDTYISTDLGPLYTGKNLGNLPMFLDYLYVTDVKDKALILEIVQHLDQKAIKREVKKFKQAQDRMKAKAKSRRG